jgi:cell shape-determining protein MreC
VLFPASNISGLVDDLNRLWSLREYRKFGPMPSPVILDNCCPYNKLLFITCGENNGVFAD